jgi:hypothetical protein
MAKAQTFGDKGKKKADTTVNVKVVKAYRSDKNTIKFVERFVKINDLSEIDKINVSK